MVGGKDLDIYEKGDQASNQQGDTGEGRGDYSPPSNGGKRKKEKVIHKEKSRVGQQRRKTEKPA